MRLFSAVSAPSARGPRCRLRTTLIPLVALAAGSLSLFDDARAAPTAAPAAPAVTAAGPSAAGIIAAVREAAVSYAKAFNAGDAKALGDQWTLGAELDEAGESLKGREAILASIMRMRSLYPQAKLAAEVTDVQPLGEGVARVQGTLSFTRQPGEEPLVSRFDSLRVLEGGRWRIAESRVVPSTRAALADLGWMLGRWQSSDPKSGTSVEATYEKVLGGHAIMGRIKTVKKDGSTVEAIDVIQADRRTGRVRSWTLDSTGSHAEGEFVTDGTSFNRSHVAAPGDPGVGDRAEWVQVLTPLGPDLVLWHSIERTLDGRPLPDADPIHLRRVK
jgi:uncharacterized protein (TIGR02246 family)